jgi:hypothetical protein
MSACAYHEARGARPQPACELADVFRHYGPAYRSAQRLPRAHLKVMHAIESCRTAALGGHREWCARCDFERYAYNSCRNRHCPKCGALAQAQWLEERQAELLPVPYFHNVFTLPHQLNPLILCHEDNRRLVLNLLFRSAAATLLQFGRNNLGGQLGVTMVLHTWDQQLRAHFHLHCLIPGGALSPDGQRWRQAHARFLFPVHALSKVFRAKFLDGLQQLDDGGQLHFPAPVVPLAGPEAFRALLNRLRGQGWVVYCKPPFAGPAKLLDYLGRYTRRVALCNGRLLSMDDGRVRFHYRDRADGDCLKVATLTAAEFIRRFLLHVLPEGFQRIRHYGFLASRNKQEALARCRELLGVSKPAPPEKKSTADWLLHLTGKDITCCPQCGHQPLQRGKLPPLRCPPAAGYSLVVSDPPIKDTS